MVHGLEILKRLNEQAVTESGLPQTPSSAFDREDIPDPRGPAVIVDGSVTTGFKFIGPFDSVDEAVKWAKSNSLAAIGCPTSVVLLQEPRQ